jgi:hypothetical protein
LAADELLHDSFSDVAGTINWNRDGVRSSEGPRGTRTIYFFHGMPEGGPLVMRTVEDHVTTGPDGQPGVLALSWQEVPPTLHYSGFVYLGGREPEKRLALPPLKEARTVDDLARFRLKFRYKAANENAEGPLNLRFGIRLEPMLTEPFAKRLEFGELTATDEWASFETSLADGKNADAFLAMLAGESPAHFKVNWSQSGQLANYRSGDTLLIDDVIITGAAQE